MYGGFHPKGDTDGLYVKRKEGGRGLISIESCVRSEENNMGLYIRESNEMLLKGVKKGGVIQTDNIMEKNEFKRSTRLRLKSNGTRRDCMASLLDTCLNKLIKSCPGNGLLEVTSKSKRKLQYLRRRNRHCEQIMLKIRSI